MIPFHHGERNFAAAIEPKLFQELRGDHNDTLAAGRDAFVEGIQRLLVLMEAARKGVATGPDETPNAGHAEANEAP